MACPVLELFHTYKKLLEDVWKKPEFFYTFFAPIKHSFNPGSKVFAKPKLKEIEAVATALALIWPEFREKYHFLLTLVNGKSLVHLKNIVIIMDFFIPVVSIRVDRVSIFLCLLSSFDFVSSVYPLQLRVCLV